MARQLTWQQVCLLGGWNGWEDEREKRREAVSVLSHHYTNEASFETGMDLRRESDGVLATVMLRKDYTGTINFFFVVWQQPDPNVAAP